MIEKMLAVSFTMLVFGIIGCLFREEYDPRDYRLPQWFGRVFSGMFVGGLLLGAMTLVTAVLDWAF